MQQNDHLRLPDYLITRLEARGIKIILAPIAYWGSAYPEPKNTGPGFSSIYAAQTLDGPRRLGEFVAPPATAGQPLTITATVAGTGPQASVLLVAQLLRPHPYAAHAVNRS